MEAIWHTLRGLELGNQLEVVSIVNVEVGLIFVFVVHVAYQPAIILACLVARQTVQAQSTFAITFET